jgi:hypothetical protein
MEEEEAEAQQQQQQQQPVEEIEALFIVGKFDAALRRCEAEMRQLEHHLLRLRVPAKGEEAAEAEGEGEDEDEDDAATTEVLESSVAVMALMIQCLYELNRTQEIMGIVNKFYIKKDNIPFDILFMWCVFD